MPGGVAEVGTDSTEAAAGGELWDGEMESHGWSFGVTIGEGRNPRGSCPARHGLAIRDGAVPVGRRPVTDGAGDRSERNRP